ncbi:hypothetical protein [Rhodococcus sp. SGAir0479]|uniref:hypothetical protein n=1 Tax=Rhodococcus sp. SGAir0479 TaxID=2567884 RepID=UPI0015868A4E|nr:hypothetical protein [Rhodococcus sp. SGAir0479]
MRGRTAGPLGHRSDSSYDSEGLVEFLINLFYSLLANLYIGSSDGSSGGGQVQNP